jgi:membrane complex biogenesis BtpA family protein
MKWVNELFGTDKPIIAMCHFRSLPGDPAYNRSGGLREVIDFAYQEMMALQDGGVDAIMFSNEFSLPYLKKVRPITTATMARIIGEIKAELRIPFGVNVLWDPYASLDLAAATGASFIREIMSGVYASDFGLWDTDSGEVARHRIEVCADDVKMLYNIVPESARYLAPRDIAEIAKTTSFNCKPDVICVSGITAGSATDIAILEKVKAVVPDTPVFANTGCKPDTIERILTVADGAVVGTYFKKDGLFDNHVDIDRVKKFMEIVNKTR